MNFYPDTPQERKKFWRTSAVYRCLVRYGESEKWAMRKLKTVLNDHDAKALLSIWRQSGPFKDRPAPKRYFSSNLF